MIYFNYHLALKTFEKAKGVSVNLKVKYDGSGQRPSGFEIEYEIDGLLFIEQITN